MKKNRILIFLILIFILLASSCSQDSIFYDISFEPEPRQPIIPGGPTNMVVLRNQVFVGSRMSNTIFSYGNSTGDLAWSVIPSPGAPIGELATDGQSLYALLFPGGDPLRASSVRRFNFQNMSWDSNISLDGYSIQSLFSAGSEIFVGIQSEANRQIFAIARYDTASSSLTILGDRTFMLTGAAMNAAGNIYLSTGGGGIYLYSGNTIFGPLTGTSGHAFSGITEVGGNIVAVTGNGYIFTDLTGQLLSYSVGVRFTGAMSIWNDPNNGYRPTLLLMGIRGRGTSVTQGYREMLLNNGRPSYNIRVPGEGTPTSVASRATYVASIGRHPVEAILQVPDISDGGPLDYRSLAVEPGWAPPIFASTSRSGLWAYRNGEWNAED